MKRRLYSVRVEKVHFQVGNFQVAAVSFWVSGGSFLGDGQFTAPLLAPNGSTQL